MSSVVNPSRAEERLCHRHKLEDKAFSLCLFLFANTRNATLLICRSRTTPSAPMDAYRFSEKRTFLRNKMQRSLLSFLTEYETPKIVSIHSLTLAILLRVIQTIIVLYSILYLLLYEQGYQKKDTAIISSVTLKVKGIGYIQTPDKQNLVIDVAGEIRARVLLIRQSTLMRL